MQVNVSQIEIHCPDPYWFEKLYFEIQEWSRSDAAIHYRNSGYLIIVIEFATWVDDDT